jgi:glycosyltransferase involved in cell wall biosynthesis
VDRVVAMSGKDCELVGEKAVCLANGVDLERFQPSGAPPEPRRILFIGSFGHLPNVLAVDFFLREAWPELRAVGATLHIIAGARHQYFLERYQDRVRLDLNQPGIEVEDFVADVRPAYERAAVVVAPLLASAGTNIKIMEAMAMGKAIVSTSAGINGLDLDPGEDVVVANSGPEMARAVREMLDEPSKRQAIETQARQTVERKFDWDVIAKQQKTLYEDLIQRPTSSTRPLGRRERFHQS